MKFNKDIWKSVVGYDGIYSVSNAGNIRRDTSGICLCIKGRILKKSLKRNGYHQVCLYKDSIKKYHQVSKLVIEAFLYQRPKGMTINHKDGVKTNNHFSNLEYMDSYENLMHAYRNKRFINGVLNDKKIINIRKCRLINKMSLKEIALKYKISPSSVSLISRFRVWKNVK